MAASPPTWFSDAALTAETLGFFASADAPSNNELWAMWNQGSATPSEREAVQGVLALDGTRAWTVERATLVPARERGVVRTWFDRLAAISQGHLEVQGVDEVWVTRWLFRHALVRVVLRANDATLSAAPVLDGGAVTLGDLLAIANAALTYGSFVSIRAAASRPDRALVCWVAPGTQQQLAELGLDVSPLPTSVDVVREGRLRQTAPPPPPPSASTENLFARLEKAATTDLPIDLATLRRPAWRPRVVDGEQADTVDKFGGVPWLAPRKRMPKCPTCKGPTSLGLQLRMESLPLQLGVGGVLQVFLCDGADPGACFIDHGGFVVRLEKGDVKARSADEGPRRRAKTIVGWDPIVDDPGCNDWPSGIDDDACEDFFDEPAPGDKCGGYGHYPQSGQPRCLHPTCDKGQLVFQVESSWEGILENACFGDYGKLFVYVCTAHGEPLVSGTIEYY